MGHFSFSSSCMRTLSALNKKANRSHMPEDKNPSLLPSTHWWFWGFQGSANCGFSVYTDLCASWGPKFRTLEHSIPFPASPWPPRTSLIDLFIHSSACTFLCRNACCGPWDGVGLRDRWPLCIFVLAFKWPHTGSGQGNTLLVQGVGAVSYRSSAEQVLWHRKALVSP